MFGRSPASLWRLSTPCLISPYKTNTAPTGCVSSRLVIILTDIIFHLIPAAPMQPVPLCSRSKGNTAYGAAGGEGRNVQKSVFPVGQMRTTVRLPKHTKMSLPVDGLVVKDFTAVMKPYNNNSLSYLIHLKPTGCNLIMLC